MLEPKLVLSWQPDMAINPDRHIQLLCGAESETGFFSGPAPMLQQIVFTIHLMRIARSPEVAQIPPTPEQTLTKNCQNGSLKKSQQ